MTAKRTMKMRPTISKNASGPVGIPLFGAPQAPGEACCIYPTPHQRKNVAQGLFKVGPVAGPEPTRIR